MLLSFALACRLVFWRVSAELSSSMMSNSLRLNCMASVMYDKQLVFLLGVKSYYELDSEYPHDQTPVKGLGTVSSERLWWPAFLVLSAFTGAVTDSVWVITSEKLLEAWAWFYGLCPLCAFVSAIFLCIFSL